MAQIPTVIIDSDEIARAEIVNTLKEIGFLEVIGDFGNMITAYDVIMQTRPPIVFFDLSDEVDLAFDTIEKITKAHRNVFIIAASQKIQADLVIQSMRAGAKEFLTKPIVKEDLLKAIKKAKDSLKRDDELKEGEIFSVFSNKGGIGKTTVATNLALQLGKLTGENVCLVDLNLQMGDVTTFLDINPSFDISYIISHLSTLDESFLYSSLERYKETNLYILADPPDIEQSEEISADDINGLLHFLKSVFAYVVVDTSSSFDVKTLTCLDISDYIFLVMMVNLPSIRNSQKCLSLFKRLDYDEDKVKLLVNRYIPDDEITIDDVEEALYQKVFWNIPNNYFTIMSSINKGLPASEMEPDAKISKNFIKFAEKLTGVVSSLRDDDDDEKEESLLDEFGITPIIEKAKSFALPFLSKDPAKFLETKLENKDDI